jgi:hypothetical protein
MSLAKKIYVAILNQGNITTELSHVINGLLQQEKYNIIVDYPADKPISFNRQNIVKKFLTTDCDYLLMIDSDIVPPLSILNLADFQEDVVAALCFAFTKGMVVPLALVRRADGQYHVPELRGNEGLMPVDAVGTGCIMIARHVLENPWFMENGGWFVNEYDKTGYKKEGLDLSFCRKAQDLGYKIFCHMDYPCSHFTRMDLKLLYASLLETGRVK